MTNSDYIKNALRMIKILAEGDTPSPEQGSDGLTVINFLVSSLAGEGVDLGIPPQSSTTDQLPVPYEYQGGFTAMLAVYLQPYYPASQVPVVVAGVAESGRLKMMNDAMERKKVVAKLDNLPRGTGDWGRGYNILLG